MLEVVQLLPGLLREEVVGDAHGELVVVGQLLDHLVVLRVVLEAAAGIDGAGDAQAIEFAHELPGGVDLVFQRQRGTLSQGRVEDEGVGPGDQHAGGIALGIALDLAAGWVGGVTVIAHRPERRSIQQRAIVEVQHEDRCVRRGPIQFLDGGHALFGELEFRPATHHPHPLRRGRVLGLLLEHTQSIRQRRNTFPAQLQVVVEAAADQVQVRVIEAGDHATLAQIDQPRRRATKGHGLGIGAHRNEAAIPDRHGRGLGLLGIDGVQAAIEQNQIGAHG